MSWRIVVISSRCKLDYKMGYLVARGETVTRVFMDEIGVLIIENPAVSLTGVLLNELTERKVKVIFCDTKRNPNSELVPHHGSHDSARKIRTQISWDKSIKGLVWREIIAEKIRNQKDFLYELGKEREGNLLSQYTEQLEEHDSTNREGHAAKVYFNAVFGMDFTRSADNAINAALNYGYSILLSAVNREVSANGYLTQIGMFHDNMFNHFNLSSDIMEPMRVSIDRVVYDLNPSEFDKSEKMMIIDSLNREVRIDGTRQFFMNALKIYTRSVFDALNEKDIAEIRFISEL